MFNNYVPSLTNLPNTNRVELNSKQDLAKNSSTFTTADNRNNLKESSLNFPVENHTALSTIPTTQKDSNRKQNMNWLVLNILYTQYEIIHDVASECGFRTSVEDDDDWDIWFIDGPVIPSLLMKMKSS